MARKNRAAQQADALSRKVAKDEAKRLATIALNEHRAEKARQQEAIALEIAQMNWDDSVAAKKAGFGNDVEAYLDSVAAVAMDRCNEDFDSLLAAAEGLGIDLLPDLGEGYQTAYLAAK